MKKLIVLLIVVLNGLILNAQQNLEKGYFITNDGERVECWIKNMDWKHNPTEFQYKRTPESETEIATVNQVLEFSPSEWVIYKSAVVDVDMSSEKSSKLSSSKMPEFKQMKLFLKLLVRGEVSLYLYSKSDMRRYFIQKENGNIEQLIYKSYLHPNGTSIIINNAYLGQLRALLICDCLKISNFQTLSYNRVSLVNIINKYNQCIDSNFIDYTVNSKKGKWHSAVKGGVRLSTFKLLNNNWYAFKSDNTFDPVAGFEIEYKMPFNNYNWALIFEPLFQSYNHTMITKFYGEATIQYSSVEVSVGIRRYFPINNKFKIYANLMGGVEHDFNSYIDINVGYNNKDHLTIEATNTVKIGIGIEYKRLLVEGRYIFDRDPIIQYLNKASKLSATGFVVGYRLF